MTLKEKFNIISCKDCDMPYCDIKCTILVPSDLDKLEQITDDFAIGFKDWCDKFTNEVGDWKQDGVCLKNRFSTKELLQIYKKESGL